MTEKKIKCINCDYEKTFDPQLIDYEKNGFSFAWDITNGLTSIPICNNCMAEINKHREVIEKIIKRDIEDVNFPPPRTGVE